MRLRVLGAKGMATAAAVLTDTISVAGALELVVSAVRPVEAETVDLGAALGRVTAAAVNALINSPRFDVSAMDGYAVSSADVAVPGTVLQLSGESRAGGPATIALEPMTCMRIFTGAPIPRGADAVVVQEDVDTETSHVRFSLATTKGLHIRKRGLNFAMDATVIPPGRRLAARDIGLIAAAGHPSVSVTRRPRVAILSTGDELARNDEIAAAEKIYDGNRPALMAAVIAWGGVPQDLGIAGDDDTTIRAALVDVDADMLVLNGGVSVGDYDRVRPALRAMGFSIDFWKVNMRPGKPLMFGSLHGIPVLGLPGNPVSALVSALLFLRPAIAAMLGSAATGWDYENARLTRPLGPTGRRDDYLRASLSQSEHGLVVEAFEEQDSSMLSILSAANALLVRPASSPGARAGEMVKVLRFDVLSGF